MKSLHTEERLHVSKLCVGCLLFCLCSTVTAQPSGGPYGPIRQTYKLPTEAGRTYYVAVDGKAEQSGETLAEPTTLEAAIERVRTANTFVPRRANL